MIISCMGLHWANDLPVRYGTAGRFLWSAVRSGLPPVSRYCNPAARCSFRVCASPPPWQAQGKSKCKALGTRLQRHTASRSSSAADWRALRPPDSPAPCGKAPGGAGAAVPERTPTDPRDGAEQLPARQQGAGSYQRRHRPYCMPVRHYQLLS